MLTLLENKSSHLKMDGLGKWSNLTHIFQRGWFNHQLEKPPCFEQKNIWNQMMIRGGTLNFKLNSLEVVGHKKPVDLRNTWGGIWTGDFCRRIRFVFIVVQFWMDVDSNGWSCMPIEAICYTWLCIWLHMIASILRRVLDQSEGMVYGHPLSVSSIQQPSEDPGIYIIC